MITSINNASIQSFAGTKITDKGNKYETTNQGKIVAPAVSALTLGGFVATMGVKSSKNETGTFFQRIKSNLATAKALYLLENKHLIGFSAALVGISFLLGASIDAHKNSQSAKLADNSALNN
jgi:hypothetical protein